MKIWLFRYLPFRCSWFHFRSAVGAQFFLPWNYYRFYCMQFWLQLFIQKGLERSVFFIGKTKGNQKFQFQSQWLWYWIPRFNTIGWLQGQLNLTFFQDWCKWVPKTPGDVLVKRCSGSDRVQLDKNFSHWNFLKIYFTRLWSCSKLSWLQWRNG